MEQLLHAVDYIKAHWEVISFVVLYLLEQILPKLQSIEANSMWELIPELVQLAFKLVKKDYTQPPKAPPA